MMMRTYVLPFYQTQKIHGVVRVYTVTRTELAECMINGYVKKLVLRFSVQYVATREIIPGNRHPCTLCR
jgi:hypothetical protein